MTSVLAVGGMARCHNFQLKLKLGIVLLFPGQDHNHQLLYIWVERGTLKENCLFQDDMATP